MITKRFLFAIILLYVALGAAQAQSVPAPREVIGFEPAEDRKLADWTQITDYFKKLDAASERVTVKEIGQSTLKRPYVVAFLSSEANIKNLAKIQENQRKLADPRLITSDSERDLLIRETPAIVAITCCIHSTEIVSSQMSMELAYRLASDQSVATKEILDNVVLILVPAVNPDGVDIVTHWYQKTLGSKYEGTSPPELYHHYVGHDDNRDWFMLTQIETQLLSKLFWQEWFPEIVYDVHQQGSFGSRMCVPPFFDPTNPNIDPLILREVGAIGYRMATKLLAAGYKGIVTNSTYDTWWHGGLRSAPYFHNAVGILTEAASCRLATPMEIKREQLRSPTRGLQNPLQAATNFPAVWEGGWWRMRDIQDLELITTRTALEEAALHKEELIRNFVDVATRAIEAGKTEAPYAYIVPAEQMDKPTADRMINILLQQGVEVHRAKSEFTIDGKKYGAGSYVILLAQPYRANVKCLFEAQKYPDRRVYPGGPAEQPYDVAGWTLPMQMGVNYVEAGKRFDTDLERILPDEKIPLSLANGKQIENLIKLTTDHTSYNANLPFYLRNLRTDGQSRIYFSAQSPNAFLLVNELLKLSDKVAISRLQHPVDVEEKSPPFQNRVEVEKKSYSAGTFVVDLKQRRGNEKKRDPRLITPEIEDIYKILQKAADEYGIKVESKAMAKPQTNSKLATDSSSLSKPRLALYKSWVGSMDEGWTRWVLEQFKFDYTSLLDKDVRAGNLRDKFDVIILPDMSPASIINGNRKGSYPDEYTGGIGEEGVAALKAFVEAGGVLICFDSSSEFAMQKFNLPVRNALAEVKTDQFYAPGSIFRAVVDNQHPVAYGMPAEADFYFVSGRRGGEEGQMDANPRNAQGNDASQNAPRVPTVRALAFEITDPNRARSVARYIEGNPLRSGWLLGPEYITGKSALVDASLGKGRVILFGFRPQHRGQTWGTFKLVFNSILLGGMKN